MPSVPDIGIAPYEADVMASPYPKDFTPGQEGLRLRRERFRAPDTVAHPVATVDDELTSEVIGAEDLVARYDTLPPVAARPAPLPRATRSGSPMR